MSHSRRCAANACSCGREGDEEMRISKGFSLVEMMVAAGIMAVFLALVIPFFIFQTSQSAQSTRTKYSDQDVDLAFTLLRRDILHAGLGCRGHEALGIFVQDGGGTDPDELYVNYGGYLNMMGGHMLEGVPDTAPKEMKFHTKFLLINSVYNSTRWEGFDYDGWNIEYQGVVDYEDNAAAGWSGTSFVLYGVPLNISKYGIGAVIGKTPGATTADTVMDVDLYQTEQPTTYPTPIPDGQQHIQFVLQPITRWTTGGTLVAREFTPAISYRVDTISQERDWPGLWRNAGPPNNKWGMPLVGGLPFFQITDFQVRCQFVNPGTGLVEWSPDDGTFGTGNLIVKNLRLVEITLAYKTKFTSSFGAKWSEEKSRKISVSPRTLVMLNE